MCGEFWEDEEDGLAVNLRLNAAMQKKSTIFLSREGLDSEMRLGQFEHAIQQIV